MLQKNLGKNVAPSPKNMAQKEKKEENIEQKTKRL